MTEITARLEELAQKTERRIGQHPDVDTIRLGVKHILDLQAQLAVETAPVAPTKPAKRSTKKDDE